MKVLAATHVATDFRLRSGVRLPELRIAYVTHGVLSAGGDNAILVTHGITSSHHAAPPHAGDAEGGWWSNVVGPGKAIDTDRYFVVSSNVLGSCFGSTGPASLHPATGTPYGPDFPALCIGDIVDAQKALLDALGIRQLVAVAGPSFGGYQAFEWGVSYPEAMRGLVVTESAPEVTDGAARLDALLARFCSDPGWHGGRYYGKAGVAGTLRALRLEALEAYGWREKLGRALGPLERQNELERMAGEWSLRFDANSLVALRRAAAGFTVLPRLPQLRARVLLVLSTTDTLFPASRAPAVLRVLEGAGV
ncbi:MAG: metX, partial [Ramlibacter sp.]|nr:metX [Ramlibacter sp.]